MRSVATSTEGVTGGKAEERAFTARRALVFSALIFLVTVALSTAIYVDGTRSLVPAATQATSIRRGAKPQSQADFLKRVDHWVLRVALLVTVGGAGCLVPLLLGAAAWRHRVLSRLHTLEEKSRELHASNALLQNQLAESGRSGGRSLSLQADWQDRINAAEERANKMSAANALLQDELNKRNRAEKALTQERQQLESSRNVLELHVQARNQELQKLQHRYESILNSAGDGICGLDSNGKTTFVNPAAAKLTGWPVAELIGKTEQQIFYRNGSNGRPPAAEQNAGEQIFYRKDGTAFPVEFVRTPLREDDRSVGAVLVFKDITERKRAEETLAQKAAELARSNSELEQFAFVASHDLQEPLRKIQAFGDRLKLKCKSARAPEARDYLERMQSAAARMQTLINDLLTFSRVIRSSQPLVPVDLAAVTREVLGDLEVRIEKTHAQVEVGELPTIEADPLQMRQLMLNLLSNALKFQPPEGTPVVKVRSRTARGAAGDELCELSVQDNGIGFEEKYLDKIFAVFQRLHGRTEFEGTGVGLAVCRRITDRHHGTITAKSKPGEGATFIVTLPLRQPKPKANP